MLITLSFYYCLFNVDCNGDVNGTAFTDSCGNCVGGNTGNVACIPFSPTVLVSISNTDCDSLTDLTINVSQDPNEPDMSTALFSSRVEDLLQLDHYLLEILLVMLSMSAGSSLTFNTY